MKLKYIPNMICVARIILVAPIVWSLLEERYALALGLILIAGLSDALDGYLACSTPPQTNSSCSRRSSPSPG
ncbi:MAG: CDP-alcohol phosphatidyltransferase family protein [Deltaproteobacteria bacterium]|nr:CDP-alcohol phosphatidyltransferase family protein [Deltaproteobacteria bacterium]